MPRILSVLIVLAAGSTSAAAQSATGIVAGLSAGGTYYCIVSRCNTGSTVGVLTTIQATRVIAVEAGARRHFCFDCDQFLIAEGAVSLQYPRPRVRPFLAAGVSYSSDPDFMGDHLGLLGATGAWIWPNERWGLRLEVRGRQVGRGDAMGEASLSVAHWFFGASN